METLHTFVTGTDQLAAGGQLLHAVRAPTGHTGHGEQGGIQLTRQTQHIVHEAAVEVDIGGNGLFVLNIK